MLFISCHVPELLASFGITAEKTGLLWRLDEYRPLSLGTCVGESSVVWWLPTHGKTFVVNDKTFLWLYDCNYLNLSDLPSWEFWQVHQTPPFRRNLQAICACSPVGSSHAFICPVWKRVIGQNLPQTTALSISSTTPNGFCDIICARYPGPRQQTSVHLHKRLQGPVTPKTCKALWGPWNSTFLPIFFTLHILFLWPFAQALRDSWFGGRADVSKSMPLSTSYFKCTGALVYAIPFFHFNIYL